MAAKLYFSVDAHPYETQDKEAKDGFIFKTIHFLCEAESDLSSDKIDPGLTEQGKQQCRAVAKSIAKCRIGTIHHDTYTRVDMLVTSSLSRGISTVLRSSKAILSARPNTPSIALDFLREPVNHLCDRRQTVSKLARKFPMIQFDLVANFDTLWDAYETQLGSIEEYTKPRESAQIYKTAERARDFLRWLGGRPEENIIVCSHKSFLKVLMNYGHSEEFKLGQFLDDRKIKDNPPLLNFKETSNSPGFAQTMRADFHHCERRSMRLAFRLTNPDDS
jgi:broad specificity phosphatase PhoE